LCQHIKNKELNCIIIIIIINYCALIALPTYVTRLPSL